MLIILKGLQKAGKALHADAHSYFFAALAILAAAVVHLPGAYIPVLAVAVSVWIVLCVLAHIPLRDDEKSALEQQLLDEKQFNENIIAQRDAAQKAEMDVEQRMRELQASADEQTGSMTAMLCTQFYLRITDRLRAEEFADASWDFITLEPNEALVAGKEVRIKLADAGNFLYADVIFAPRSGILKMNISKPVQDIPQAPVESVKKTVENSERKKADGELRAWLKEHASDVEDAGFEANKRGLTTYLFTKNLPADKSLWPRLCELLVIDEFYESAEPADDGIRIEIKDWRNPAAV